MVLYIAIFAYFSKHVFFISAYILTSACLFQLLCVLQSFFSSSHSTIWPKAFKKKIGERKEIMDVPPPQKSKPLHATQSLVQSLSQWQLCIPDSGSLKELLFAQHGAFSRSQWAHSGGEAVYSKQQPGRWTSFSKSFLQISDISMLCLLVQWSTGLFKSKILGSGNGNDPLWNIITRVSCSVWMFMQACNYTEFNI